MSKVARRPRVPVGRFAMRVEVTEASGPTALLYNEDRGLYLETPLSEELRAMMGGDVLAYFWCEVAEGNVIFHERAPGQDW